MKLHYSQTVVDGVPNRVEFNYHLKLHYSQTQAYADNLVREV